MKLLAIDTSTERATVALITQGEISQAEHSAMRQHAQLILPMIDQLLVDAGVRLNELDGIVFGRGPGSFTGLRIACSVAKGLAYAHDLPLFPVSTLDTIADEVLHMQAHKGLNGILAIIDARMNQVYWACYQAHLNVAPECVSDVSDIQIRDDFPLILAGVGYQEYRRQLPEAIMQRVTSELEIYPKAASMLTLVLNGRVEALSAAEALPVYLRNQVVQGGVSG